MRHRTKQYGYIFGLCIVNGIERPLRINYDNKAVELCSKNNRSSSKSKHIDLSFWLLRRMFKVFKCLLNILVQTS